MSAQRRCLIIAGFVSMPASVMAAQDLPTGQSPPSAVETELPTTASLEPIAHFSIYQPTGIAVSETGRVFVNFPLWSDQHLYSVVEILPDGTTQPYPDKAWNSWRNDEADTRPGESFVCVQSVWADGRGGLWILDAASPRFDGVVPGGAKLVKVDLATNQVTLTFLFADDAAPPNSYLNDVRVDLDRQTAYITDSGLGAIVVVNLQDMTARRLLEAHQSTRAEPGIELTIDGRAFRDSSGSTPQIHADGLALSPDGVHLYYHALTGKSLYRMATQVLRNPLSTTEELANAVENLGETVVTDGMEVDAAGYVYHTAVEQNAIVRWTPAGEMETVVQSELLKWPDSLALAADGWMYVTTSQIHLMARFNNGESKRIDPYRVLRFKRPGLTPEVESSGESH